MRPSPELATDFFNVIGQRFLIKYREPDSLLRVTAHLKSHDDHIKTKPIHSMSTYRKGQGWQR
jgi:hypothetical protein